MSLTIEEALELPELIEQTEDARRNAVHAGQIFKGRGEDGSAFLMYIARSGDQLFKVTSRWSAADLRA